MLGTRYIQCSFKSIKSQISLSDLYPSNRISVPPCSFSRQQAIYIHQANGTCVSRKATSNAEHTSPHCGREGDIAKDRLPNRTLVLAAASHHTSYIDTSSPLTHSCSPRHQDHATASKRGSTTTKKGFTKPKKGSTALTTDTVGTNKGTRDRQTGDTKGSKERITLRWRLVAHDLSALYQVGQSVHSASVGFPPDWE